MNITGYAFKENSEEIQNDYKNRLKEIEHLKPEIQFQEFPDYKRTHFSGEINGNNDEAMELSEQDLFIIITNGRIPFGGFIHKVGNSFTGDIYND